MKIEEETVVNQWLKEQPWKSCIYTGKWTKNGRETIAVDEPAKQMWLTEVGSAGEEDIRRAAKDASRAGMAWAMIAAREKADVFLKAANFLQTHFTSFSEIVARETGGARFKGEHEVRECITLLKLAAGMALQPHGITLPDDEGKLSFAKRKPIGVVGVISPFNFPMVLSTRSVAPALATGNAVISKPDPRTPLSGGFLLALALEHAGLPAGTYQVLPGYGDAGNALCTSNEVGMIAFTGSTHAGRLVGETCGRHLKKVSLELGGKSALIILDDADIDIAASNIAWGAFLHQGQICMASGRILVHRSIAKEVIAKIVGRAKTLSYGDLDSQCPISSLISAQQLEKVSKIVEDSVEAGAIVQCGGYHEGLFYAPTVLTDVSPGMRCFEEEIFGPVVNIVTYDTDEEAIELANSGDYGLAGAVISNDLTRAMQIGAQLEVGLLHINDQTVNDNCCNPFGGFKSSGNGSAVCGPADWDLYTHWQWQTISPKAQLKPF